MKTTFLGEPCAFSEDATYYHGFKKGGTVFSALHYVVFNHKGQQFFGKIQSIFKDVQEDKKMAEVSVFQFPAEDGADRGNGDYHEVWAVLHDTMEIPISAIEAKEVTLVHVPPNISDDKILEYVDENIGKVEHEEGEDSDYDSDDDMSDFIVKGEVFGFYQYGIDQNDKLHYAPTPKFSDKYLSFESIDDDDKLQHEFVEHLKYRYIAPKLECFKNKSIHFTDEELIQKLLFQQYTVNNDKFYFVVDDHPVQMDCDINKAKTLTAFVFLLKTMLTKEKVPSVIDMYNFCLKFELGL